MKFNYIIKQLSLLPMHIIGTFCYTLSYFYPKNKDLWIYGAWFGKKFNDNSMYFYKYMINTHTEVKSVWITKDKKIYDYLKKGKYPVEKANSFKGIMLHLRAGVAVLTSGKYDVNQNFLSGKTKIIQLWHGIPLKKIVYDTYLNNIYNSFVKYLFFLPVLRNLLRFDIVITTSEYLKKRYANAFKLKDCQVPATGYPRNDIFFKSEKSNPNKEKVILYAPTLRNEGLDGRTAEIISLDKLTKVNEALKESNSMLYIKLHYKEENFLKDIELSNIILLKRDPFFDMQEFLTRTDILITDYSSIYFDYLLLDRPIIFFAYDLDDYIRNDRGFYDKYEDVTPGPVAKSWSEVIENIEESLKYPDKYSRERKLLCNKCWDHQDGNSSNRVYEEIIKRSSND